MIKAVIFDFDGTLVDFVNSDIACLKHILGEADTNVDPEEFIERAVFHIMEFHVLVDSGKVNPLTLHGYRLVNTFNDLGISWDKRYVDMYKANLLENTKPYPGVRALMSNLQDNVKLGILTNAYDPEMQTKRIRASGLFDFFDRIQISGEEEYAKPNSKAFYLICNRLGNKPEECVFIGDSPKYDIDGAITAGLQTILIQRENNDLEIEPDYRVDSVEELEPILKIMIA